MDRASESYRQSSLEGEEPSLEWIEKGWRAIALYLTQAADAVHEDDRQRKLDMVDKALKLLEFLIAITPGESPNKLGKALSDLYRNVHLAIVDANARNDAQALRRAREDILSIETEVRKTHDLKGPRP